MGRLDEVVADLRSRKDALLCQAEQLERTCESLLQLGDSPMFQAVAEKPVQAPLSPSPTFEERPRVVTAGPRVVAEKLRQRVVGLVNERRTWASPETLLPAVLKAVPDLQKRVRHPYQAVSTALHKSASVGDLKLTYVQHRPFFGRDGLPDPTSAESKAWRSKMTTERKRRQSAASKKGWARKKEAVS